MLTRHQNPQDSNMKIFVTQNYLDYSQPKTYQKLPSKHEKPFISMRKQFISMNTKHRYLTSSYIT